MSRTSKPLCSMIWGGDPDKMAGRDQFPMQWVSGDHFGVAKRRDVYQGKGDLGGE